MNKTDYALMVLGCDKNAELIPMFLRNLKKYWPQYQKEVYINTESVRTNSDVFKLVYPTHVCDINTPWARRLYDFLREYPYDYVVFLLDDFILSDFVDDDELNRVHSIMKQHPEIACFNFMETYKDAEDSVGEAYERYYLKDRKAEFRMNLQAAIWRKDYLMKFIRKHENPWQFETWGSIRSRRYKDEIYHIRKNAPHVFIYPEGGVFADGKWYEQKTIDFLNKEGFDVDLSVRGVYRIGDSRKTEIKHRSFIQKVWEVTRSLI